jgi:hypothetical protein
MLELRYWTADVSGRPVKVKAPVPPNPYCWPNIRTALIVVLGDYPEEFMEFLIEDAKECGWGFNPITRTFYRLD